MHVHVQARYKKVGRESTRVNSVSVLCSTSRRLASVIARMGKSRCYARLQAGPQTASASEGTSTRAGAESLRCTAWLAGKRGCREVPQSPATDGGWRLCFPWHQHRVRMSVTASTYEYIRTYYLGGRVVPRRVAVCLLDPFLCVLRARGVQRNDGEQGTGSGKRETAKKRKQDTWDDGLAPKWHERLQNAEAPWTVISSVSAVWLLLRGTWHSST